MKDVIVGILIVTALSVVVVAIAGVFLVLVWGVVVPDVFSGAVAQGLLPATLTVWQAIELMFLATFVMRFATVVKSSKE